MRPRQCLSVHDSTHSKQAPTVCLQVRGMSLGDVWWAPPLSCRLPRGNPRLRLVQMWWMPAVWSGCVLLRRQQPLRHGTGPLDL